MHTITATSQTIGVKCEISKFQNKGHMSESSPVFEEERGRKVDFNEVVAIRRIDLAASEYSSQEVEDCWYTRVEYKRMRHEMSHTVKVIERGDFYGTNTGQHCARGLESRSPIKTKEKRRAKDIIVLSVLIEQSQQEEDHVYKPEALAMVSTRCSSVSRSQAEIRGELDAIEASKLYNTSDYRHKGTKLVPKSKIKIRHVKAALISKLQICNEAQ